MNTWTWLASAEASDMRTPALVVLFKLYSQNENRTKEEQKSRPICGNVRPGALDRSSNRGSLQFRQKLQDIILRVAKARMRLPAPFCLTGKSIAFGCPVLLAKTFPFSPAPNQLHNAHRPVPNEGRCATS